MIFAVKPFEIHDGDGIRTTVFFKGCPLRCRWCHNPESLSAFREPYFDAERCVNCLKCVSLCAANREEGGLHRFDASSCDACGRCEAVCAGGALSVSGWEESAEEIAEEVLKDELFFRGSGGGVTFSGGEPLMQIDLALRLAKLLAQKKIGVAVDTSAFVPWTSIEAIAPYTELFLFDVKAVDEEVHIACTGQSNRLILDNIRRADTLGVPFEIRYPYVPSFNDGEAQSVGRFAAPLRNLRLVRILPYHSYAEHKYRCLGRDYTAKDVPLPAKEALEEARERIASFGVKVVIG